jgi:anti-sigma B factor antagonist
MTDSPIRTTSSGVVVVRPMGRLNMVTAPDLREQLRALVQRGSVRLVVGLSGVDTIDSTGLSALISGLKAARQAGGSLHIAQPSKQVKAILRLTSLDRVLTAPDAGDTVNEPT